MEHVKEHNTEKRKIKKLIINFIIIMLILTFFSNTINNFLLPKVSASNPIPGSLTKEIDGYGFIEPKESTSLYADGNKKIEDIKVKVGDEVTKNQVLVVFKKEDLEFQLKEENMKYDQLNLSLEKLKNEMVYKQKDSERKIDTLKEKMNSEKVNLDNLEKLFKSGYEAKSNVDKQTIVYHDAKTAYEQAIDDNAKDINTSENLIKEAECNLEMAKLKIEKINKDINTSSNTLLSPYEGVITKINFERGQTTDGFKPIIVINNVSKGFQFKMSVSMEDLKYLSLGDSVDVSIKCSEIKNVKGTIVQIVENLNNKNENKGDVGENSTNGKKDLIINIEATEVTGGEAAEGLINKDIGSYPMMVPNSSINYDQNGAFIWVIRERKGALGTESYLDKAPVSIGQSDTLNTVIQSGITLDEKVVTKIEEGKTVSRGCSVILEN